MADLVGQGDAQTESDEALPILYEPYKTGGRGYQDRGYPSGCQSHGGTCGDGGSKDGRSSFTQNRPSGPGFWSWATAHGVMKWGWEMEIEERVLPRVQGPWSGSAPGQLSLKRQALSAFLSKPVFEHGTHGPDCWISGL